MINVSNEMYERPVIMDSISSLQFSYCDYKNINCCAIAVGAYT